MLVTVYSIVDAHIRHDCMIRIRADNERINFTSTVEFACSNRKFDLLESTFDILLNCHRSIIGLI